MNPSLLILAIPTGLLYLIASMSLNGLFLMMIWLFTAYAFVDVIDTPIKEYSKEELNKFSKLSRWMTVQIQKLKSSRLAQLTREQIMLVKQPDNSKDATLSFIGTLGCFLFILALNPLSLAAIGNAHIPFNSNGDYTGLTMSFTDVASMMLISGLLMIVSRAQIHTPNKTYFGMFGLLTMTSLIFISILIMDISVWFLVLFPPFLVWLSKLEDKKKERETTELSLRVYRFLGITAPVVFFMFSLVAGVLSANIYSKVDSNYKKYEFNALSLSVSEIELHNEVDQESKTLQEVLETLDESTADNLKTQINIYRELMEGEQSFIEGMIFALSTTTDNPELLPLVLEHHKNLLEIEAQYHLYTPDIIRDGHNGNGQDILELIMTRKTNWAMHQELAYEVYELVKAEQYTEALQAYQNRGNENAHVFTLALFESIIASGLVSDEDIPEKLNYLTDMDSDYTINNLLLEYTAQLK